MGFVVRGLLARVQINSTAVYRYSRACSRYGICDDGIDGTGECYYDARCRWFGAMNVSHAQNYPFARASVFRMMQAVNHAP